MRRYMNRINITKSLTQCFFISLFLLLCVSCNYLDVSDELSDNLTMDKTFNTPSYVKRWHAGLFNCVSTYSQTWDGGDGFTGFWCSMCGETLVSSGWTTSFMVSGFNSGNAPAHRWGKLYQEIRDAQIFIKNVHPIGNPGDREVITEDEVNRMVAEAKFLIAYSYFSLFELYGPVPFLDELKDPEDKDLDYARLPINDFLKKVDDLLVEVINSGYLSETHIKQTGSGNDRYNLNEILRPTKTTALALRAKLWVYAASDLFNGKYEETLTLKNTDGTLLFAPYDQSKWEKAKVCLEDLFKDADSKGHKLYYASDGDPNKSVYELFQYYNDEILWASGNNQYNSYDGERFTDPRDMYGGWSNSGVTQQSVDAFFDKNGLCIDDENTVYTEVGFSKIPNPCNNVYYEDYVFNMYANREPRFYAAVMYHGKSWHIQPNWSPGWRCTFAKGGWCDNSSSDHPRAGYLLSKFKNRQILREGDYIKSWARPEILFRLADFYLYYAETLNELNPSDPKIIEYLDKVRERAGIKGYRQLKEEGLKDIIGNQELQREAIRHERQVELFAEGQRYFDIRRWMIADEGMPGDQSVIWGMNLNGYEYPQEGQPNYFTRTIIERRAWQRAMYLYPIPDSEIQKSRDKLLVQNPLWN